jgi:signal transduction histidine kinase
LWIGHDHGVVVLRPLPVTEASGATPWRTLLRPSARNEATPGALPLPTQPGEALALTPAEGLVVQRPGSFIETSAGHIWIGSAVWAPGAPGLIEFDGRTLRAYSAEHGLSDDPVIAIAEDRDRNLWLGTDAGAIRLARIGLTAYGQRDGLAPGVVEAIVAGRQGDIYALTRGLLIHRFDGTRFVGVRPNVGSAEWSGGSQAPLIDRLGEWWIPTHQGLYRFSPPRRLEDLAHARPSAIYGAADGVPSGPILGPSEDDRGDLWFGVSGHDAAVRWERATGRFHVYGERDGLAGAGAAVAFRNDRAGNLWIGFQRGAVARLRGGRFLMFRSADGVPSGTIATLHLDRSGRLWVGSRDAGIAYMTPAELSASGSGRRSRPAELARVDEPAAEQPRIVLYAPDVLAGFGVSDIAEDRQGQLHIAGDQGVQRLDPATGRINRYTVADGLPSEDVQNALADAEGRLWFGTRRGVARLVLSSNEPAPPTPVSIGQLRIRGIPHPIAELGQTDVSGLELEADQNQIEIDFFALAFAAGRPPLYQYRLDGADTDWGPPSEQRRVTYVALSPGQYRFLVRAVTADGTASKPATVAFVILRPLWQRPWFVALALAALMLAVYSIHRARVARLLAVERMRTRIATDLHDDIGSSLSQIAILSEVIQQRHPDSVELAHPLARIAATSRELVDSMSDIVWAINPQRDSLLDLVQRMRRFANDVLGARGIAFTFQAPATDDHLRLGVDVRRHVFLIFKEAVNNVARHSSSTHAAIALSCLDGTLMLSVEDNGLGFQAAVKPQGHGLASMRSRAAAIDGTVTIAAAPDGGTHVRLEVPLRARGWPFGR